MRLCLLHVFTVCFQVTVGVKQSDNTIVKASESLCSSHIRLTSADIANTGSGDIMIATSDGQLSSAIQCYLVNVKLSGKNITIKCKNGASLYTKSQVDYGSTDNTSRLV